MTDTYRITLCDIDLILKELDEETKNKIPAKMRSFIHENKSQNYISNIDTKIPLENQKLRKETKAFLAMLYLNYWCVTQEEKEEFKAQLNQNEIDYQKELQEKYSVENLFKKPKEEVVENTEINEDVEETAMVEYKESIFRKILNKIFSFFRR